MATQHEQEVAGFFVSAGSGCVPEGLDQAFVRLRHPTTHKLFLTPDEADALANALITAAATARQ